MGTRGHSVIQLVNFKEHLVRVVNLGRKNAKISDLPARPFLQRIMGVSQMPHRYTLHLVQPNDID